MNTIIKALVALLPVIIAEGALRSLMNRDTSQEIKESGVFIGPDAPKAAELIAKRRHRIAASFMLSNGLTVTGAFAIMRDPVINTKFLGLDSYCYGLMGIFIGLMFILLTWLFARYVSSINFRKDKPQDHWKSYLTGPIRTITYIYNTLWLIST